VIAGVPAAGLDLRATLAHGAHDFLIPQAQLETR